MDVFFVSFIHNASARGLRMALAREVTLSAHNYIMYLSQLYNCHLPDLAVRRIGRVKPMTDPYEILAREVTLHNVSIIMYLSQIYNCHLPDLDYQLAQLIFVVANTRELPYELHNLISRSFLVESVDAHGCVKREVLGVLHSVDDQPSYTTHNSATWHINGLRVRRKWHPTKMDEATQRFDAWVAIVTTTSRSTRWLKSRRCQSKASRAGPRGFIPSTTIKQ